MRQSGRQMGKRHAAGAALLAVVLVLAFAATHPRTQSAVLQWVPAKVLRGCKANPAGCDRDPLDGDLLDADSQASLSAAEDGWDVGGGSPPQQEEEDAEQQPPEERQTPEEQQQASDAEEEALVLNQLVPGQVGRVPTGASRSSVLAQRELIETLYAHEMGFPEERLRSAVSYGGRPERLRRLLHKLIRGDAISVATVGGSVTAGVGADTQDLSYRERLFHWLRTTFPNDGHTFVNGALAAAPSSYMSQCIQDYAPPESDLVFVEFTMNDGQKTCDVTTDGRRGFEVLLRKLLAYPRKPAVIILHWWSPGTQDFWVSPEDQLDVFSKFYGLPALSWRDAVHDLIAANASRFTFEDLYFDHGHPNGYNGHRYFADIIIGFLRNEAASLLLTGLDVSAEPPAAEDMPPIPEPMHEGNYEGKSKCLRGQSLQDAVVSSEGWEWADEMGRQKWGYVSWNPGDSLRIKADTQTYRGRSMVLVGVGILRSYQHMGSGQLSCVSGCECESLTFDGHWDTRTSQMEWVYLSVGQDPECVVEVRNMNATNSGEHKVKVTGFLVSNLHNSSAKWFSHIDELKLHEKKVELWQKQKQQQQQQKSSQQGNGSGSAQDSGGSDARSQQQDADQASGDRDTSKQQPQSRRSSGGTSDRSPNSAWQQQQQQQQQQQEEDSRGSSDSGGDVSDSGGESGGSGGDSHGSGGGSDGDGAAAADDGNGGSADAGNGDPADEQQRQIQEEDGADGDGNSGR